MEDLIGKVAQRGGSFEEAMQITLPEAFDKWLIGGMERFEVNVRYLFARFGGEVPEEELSEKVLLTALCGRRPTSAPH